jgi:hypothetical protein
MQREQGVSSLRAKLVSYYFIRGYEDERWLRKLCVQEVRP